MDGEIVELFNKMGAGTFIVLMITIFGFISFVVVKVCSIFEKYKGRVVNQTIEEQSLQTLKTSVENLVTSVHDMTDKVQNIESNFRDFKYDINNKLQDLNHYTETHENEKDEIVKSIAILKDSNLASIKSYIVTEYNHWMKEGYIDIYTMSIIEERYDVYKKLHGNTFVKDLVFQLRKLQSRSCVTDEHGNDPVNYFNSHPENHPRMSAHMDPDFDDNDLFNEDDSSND